MRLGVKAAPHDVAMMRTLPEADFVETVLQGKDLADDAALRRTAAAFQDLDMVVHVPFTIPGGPEVDVAAQDLGHRAASFAMWEASCHLADRLDAKWVVLHPGGIVPEVVHAGAAAGAARADAMEATEEALVRLGEVHGKERLLLENMPSHYHRADGATDRCLTGIAVVDFMAWGDLLGGICLDISHAWLTPGARQNLDAFLGRVDDRIRHLHVSDARAPDHEGLQIGDGDVPWADLRQEIAALEAAHGGLSAVPEVKGGHEDAGAGFRRALDFLATHFV